ncbi:MAG: SLATT domain-containing protein [Parcubacteria group bacterium]
MEAKEKIIREAKRIEEDSLYSSKGHFYAAQSWTNLHLWIGIPTSIMAAIAGASALSQFDNHQIVAGILAILVAALSAVATFINPNEKSSNHHSAGNSYNSLKNRARIFREIDIDLKTSEDLLKKLKTLNAERDEMNDKSPQIPKWAFLKARKGIEDGEAQYRVDQ